MRWRFPRFLGLLVAALVVLGLASCVARSPEPGADHPVHCDQSDSTETGPPVSDLAQGSGVRLDPGDPAGEIVAASAEGTVFSLGSGRHQGFSVRPKSGQTFLGEPGAILDGRGAPFAFRSASPGVRIADLEVTGYEPESKEAVIQGDPGATAWSVSGVDVHDNDEIGIKAISGWKISSNLIHHNGRYGLTGSGADVLVSGNEIYCNATVHGATGDSGGTKFVHTTDLVLRDNYVHDNYGNGLWVDINNSNPLIEGNDLVRNELSGIHLEISCGGLIRSNHLEENGYHDENPNWMSGSAISVALTPDVEVYDNSLSGNAMGIGGIQWDHGNVEAVDKCVPQLRNLSVHDNVVSQAVGAAAGIDAGNYTDVVWDSWNNVFSDNTYELSEDASFRWGGGWVSEEEWNQAGQG